MHTAVVRWYVKDGKLPEAAAALTALVQRVRKEEAGTLGYLVHSGAPGSFPPLSENVIVFVEIYEDDKAFLAHLNGPAFTEFVAEHGDLFVAIPGRQQYMTVETVDRIAGFLRPGADGGG